MKLNKRLFLPIAFGAILFVPVCSFAGENHPADSISRFLGASSAVKTLETSEVITAESVTTLDASIYAKAKKKKKKKKKKRADPSKLGKKVYATTCALSGCHAGQDASQFAGYTESDILTLGYGSTPEMENLTPPSNKSLSNLVKYLATLK